ncbi:GNAT family N-acetyltransferase/peptidase C39 family protein [Paucibacter sp. Y2R2-4]|uniref:GNAT family N-acetyltransferase/peptidase C39 family protein n=1 Tax=Paucibacter sp. Y2R2-4 TaxID=2893553 RepID=UPI0021E48607|nr:GNAT family N-acetyltransferase/peptidase C39 family protein [Paucibacter sp. Y2R2-4]MCV2349490.1 GNAT family N-acetyltransferase/peptidase C39 family protein [Paucibacter sp. Y2R2-4]
MPEPVPRSPTRRPRRTAKADSLGPIRISSAQPLDLAALTELEQAAFSGDRISARSWQHLIRSDSAMVLVARGGQGGGELLGAAVVLRRARSSVARLYSIAVAASARGRGLSDRLLGEVLHSARDSGAAVLRLETRLHNHAAQRLFKRHGFSALDRKPAYYEDGADALRFQKSLWDSGRANQAVALQAPFYCQTLDFTCGPCALLMAMAALDPSTVIDRAAEIRLWREATTVFMAAGHGGCGPFGLALAALQRGFGATVYAPAGASMFIESVRDPRKKDVIALVEADFRSELLASKAEWVNTALTPQRLAEHLRQGGVPLVLISLWRLHGEKGPHWVVVTGFDGQVFRILDPIAPAPAGADPGLSVSVDEFKRMARYGRRRQGAAVILSKGT